MQPNPRRAPDPRVVAMLEAARREQLRRTRSLGDDPSQITPSRWASKHRRIDGRLFTLDRHLPLQQIYDDNHPFQVIMKPAQVGVSEMAVTRAMHALDVGATYWRTGKMGLNVAYLFPTIKSLSDFSKERVASLKGETEHIGNMFFGGYDEVTFKQAGASYLYLRGAWASRSGNTGNAALKSFPADVLILDEFDEMDPMAVALAEKRLRATTVRIPPDLWGLPPDAQLPREPLVGMRLYVSTPTLPGRGVHAAYLLSDQREWEIPCPQCHTWHTLDFFRDVRGNGQPYDVWQNWERLKIRSAHWTIECPNCKGELNRFAPGRWVARNPEITDIRGYHVPALCFPMVQLVDLAVNATSGDPSQVEEFFRSDLGVPYQKAGANITDTMLDQLSYRLDGGRLPENVNWSNTTMGVDVGSRFHYRITSTGPDKERYVRAMGAVATWEDLDDLMRRYKVRHCVIDALPELHACEQWASRWPGKVKRAFYPAAAAIRGLMFRADDDLGQVQINRTMAMDAVFASISAGIEHWPKEVLATDEVRSHLKAPVRVMVNDAQGQPSASWTHTGPDHLFHASVYDMIAFETLPKSIMGVLAQGKVKGW